MKQLEDATVVVTGGASGIGLAVVRQFAEAGSRVILLDLQKERGEAAAAGLRAEGRKCSFVACDVSSEADVRSAIEAGLEGANSIDVVVNNAGMTLVKPVETCTVEEWDLVMAVNVRSIFLTTKYAAPYLRRSRLRSIVNIGSISSFVGQLSTAAYVASKGAVAMLTKALALELANDGIRVNCVCPGITDTPMLWEHLSRTADPEGSLRKRLDRVPLNRILTGEDMAQSVVFLASPAASGITGTTLLVDGGYLSTAEWTNQSAQTT